MLWFWEFILSCVRLRQANCIEYGFKEVIGGLYTCYYTFVRGKSNNTRQNNSTDKIQMILFHIIPLVLQQCIFALNIVLIAKTILKFGLKVIVLLKITITSDFYIIISHGFTIKHWYELSLSQIKVKIFNNPLYKSRSNWNSKSEKCNIN